MRRVVVDALISLDGYFAGPRDELDWFVTDDDSMGWSHDILRGAGTILYGRVTYEGMAKYWTTAVDVDPFVKERLNELPKVVFSRTLPRASWHNSTLVREDTVAAVELLKQQAGKDLVVLGSGKLVAALARASLIDDYMLRLQPVILGAGRPLFESLPGYQRLRLVASKTFRSGVLGLHYQPAAPEG